MAMNEQDLESSTPLIFPGDGVGEAPAWERLETGRFMPRRIRGSYHGRELG